MLKDARIETYVYTTTDPIDLHKRSFFTTSGPCMMLDIDTLWGQKWYKNEEMTNGNTDTDIHIDFFKNEKTGIIRTETYKWRRGRYLGRKREYIKNKI